MAQQEQLERIRKRAKEIRQGVNTLTEAQEAGMEVEQDTTVDEARSFVEQPTPEETPATNNEGAVEAESMQSSGTPDTPEPTAQTEQEGFQAQLGEAVESAQSNLEKTIKEQRDQALKRQDDLNKKLEKLQQESDPENRETFDQEQRIIENQLDAAEAASESLEEDFMKRRQTVEELSQVLTEGNQAIEQARNQPVAMSVLNKSVTQTAQNAQARAGVLEATLSGLDGNINAAHSIINNASNAVASVWNDQLAYNQAYMKLVEGGQLAKNKIHDQYAQNQITLAENKLNTLEETKTYIKELMIDPQSAQFIADAGVTLNDSIEDINTKMAEQGNRVEREETKNELVKEGYEYVPFPGDRNDVVQLEVGGETMSFVPPVEEDDDPSGSDKDKEDDRRFTLSGEVKSEFGGMSTTAELLGLNQNDLRNVQEALDANIDIETIVASSNLTQQQADFLRQNAQNIQVEGNKEKTFTNVLDETIAKFPNASVTEIRDRVEEATGSRPLASEVRNRLEEEEDSSGMSDEEFLKKLEQ